MTLITIPLSFLAALLTLIAFAIDIALYVVVRDRVSNLDYVGVHSIAAPGENNVFGVRYELNHASLTGFWMTLASLILLFLAGCTVCYGRRRSRMSGAIDYDHPEKPGSFSCFRRV